MGSVTTFKWAIQDFSLDKFSLDQKLVSAKFKPSGFDRECNLRMYPNDKDVPGHSTLTLDPMDSDYATTKGLYCNFWMENSVGEKIAFKFCEDHPDWLVVSHALIFPPQSTFIRNNAVFVCCEIGHKKLENNKPPTPSYEIPPLMVDVHKKMLSLFKEGITGTCTIHVAEKSFQIEKALLMAHSTVFEEMFTSGMKENQTNSVVIKNTNPETMQVLLDYIYSCEIEDASKLTEELYYLSDKYALHGLKAKCGAHLANTLDKTNIVKRLALAFRHNDKDLQERAMAYAMNPSSNVGFRYIFTSDEWYTLTSTNKSLTSQIMCAYVDKTGGY